MQKKKGMNVKGRQLLRKPAFFCDLINGGLFNGRQRILPHMLRGMPEVLGYSSEMCIRDRSYPYWGPADVEKLRCSM